MNGRASDPLPPSPEESSAVLHASRRQWTSLLIRALSAQSFPSSCLNLSSLLHQTPALPSRAKIEELVSDTSTYLEGFSVWGLDAPLCDLGGNIKKSALQKIIIGSVRPTFCHFSNELPSEWSGIEGCHCTSGNGNYLFAFVLGWAYVLSARLIELRKESEQDHISYTEEKATCDTTATLSNSDSGVFISIGEADVGECRWWAAVLAKGCGWRAALKRSGRDFYPMWSCHLASGSPRIQIRHGQLRSSSPTASHPPASEQAQHYLCKFTKLHNAHDQLLAAFVAALTIPEQGRFGAPITLPWPILRTQAVGTPVVQTIIHHCSDFCQAKKTYHISWHTAVVTCNLAGEWLLPPVEEIVPSLLKERRYDVIVRMMAHRRPNSAPLWLGSTITGLLPRLFEIAGNYLPTISLESTQWTQSPQSFMDPQYHGKVQCLEDSDGCKLIRRAEEFRLMYLTDIESSQYGPPPLCPWKPLGTTALKSATIEVQSHALCGHRLTYNHWVWQGNGHGHVIDAGITVKQARSLAPGFNLRISYLLYRLRLRTWSHSAFNNGRPSMALVAASRGENLSRLATRNLFNWTLRDGTKPEESAIWTHEWLEGLIDALDDEDDEDDTLGHDTLD
ncbi:hypothetical protein Z517_09165 [Fonsecaea pedrosoi CBS 271.37]|uniref:Uncharacterized protein n=1 Tax=Fonsecaea pedrosoi CBS 271.37 TaxID=1442368 RepID=A0A0D2DGB2_9EURO|nr:uncharacterized protein Z517_09165 [Fonsecaea pedrosoi CBS 271.37]KIW76721.1 hypothetical protein Z517_09165 [Fonsecaea pedrosoi CBS 271.37]